MTQHYSSKYLILFIYCLLAMDPSVSGQKNCNNFACAYLKAENFLNSKEYLDAFINMESAEGYLTEKDTREKEDIKKLRKKLFNAIEKEKEDAKSARDAEIKAKDEVKKALTQKEIERQNAVEEKNKADRLFKMAEHEKNVAENQKIYAIQQVEIANAERLKTEKMFQLLEKLLHLNEVQNEISEKQRSLVDEQVTIQTDIITKTLKENFRKKRWSYLLLPIQYTSVKLVSINELFNLESLPRKQEAVELKIQLKEIYDQNISYSFVDSLDLRSNSLTDIPLDILIHKRLKVLKAGNNNLSHFPANLTNFYNLISLELDSNKFIIFPSEIFSLNNLVDLDLSHNELSTISAEIKRLTRLRVLSLNFNRLVNCPFEIGQMVSLEYLLLRGNGITTMPESIEKLIKLKYLDLRENPITNEEQEKIKKLLPNCEIYF
jgi:Leucine rich repeat